MIYDNNVVNCVVKMLEEVGYKIIAMVAVFRSINNAAFFTEKPYKKEGYIYV